MSDLYDYVFPNFAPIDPTPAFPDLTAGAPRGLIIDGRSISDPHKWYYDRRQQTGFLNTDEANLVHQLALPFAGRRALEIGCASGYSSWHLLAAGLELVICDPLLQFEENRDAVSRALEEFSGHHAFIGVPSPDGAREIGRVMGPWAFVFIDGNHDAPQPIIDAAVARHFCAADAMIVFHDAVLLPVFEAMVMLVAMGWKARIYHTSQVIGCCWRGDVAPVAHVPDPALLARKLPGYLKMFDR